MDELSWLNEISFASAILWQDVGLDYSFQNIAVEWETSFWSEARKRKGGYENTVMSEIARRRVSLLK